VTAPGLEQAAVEAANTAFYAAFEEADVDAMAQIWDDEQPEALTCIHPGWPPLRGREQVLRSWSALMANTDYIQFFLTDVTVAVEGDIAVVTCTENVLTGVTESGGAGAAVATNVFRRRSPHGWRLQVHHAGPLLTGDPAAGDLS
jgi:ketosteroid isomerase-like protein